MRLFIRPRLQFSLRVFLALFLFAGLAFGWIGRHVREHRLEQRLVAEIHSSAAFNPPGRKGKEGSDLLIFL